MEKILVIEDEKEVGENIKDLLELKGYNVHLVENGEIAISKLNEDNYNLIISDIMMPKKDGFELLEDIQKRENSSFTPFIFLSAKTDISSIRKGMNLGADDYLIKPFRAEDLFSAIETRLKKKSKFDKRFQDLGTNITTYVPHELRTPLVAILGYSQFLLESFDDYNKLDVVDFIKRINVAGKRLYKTIEKFLLVAELEIMINNKENYTEYISEVTEQVDKRIESIAKNIITEKQSNLAVNLNLVPADIHISEDHFNILIREVIENATKFSDGSAPIEIKSYLYEENYFIEIINIGIGMSKDEIDSSGIFIQHHREITNQNGNGLGLFLANQICKFYNYEFKIESITNDSTKVTIIIKDM